MKPILSIKNNLINIHLKSVSFKAISTEDIDIESKNKLKNYPEIIYQKDNTNYKIIDFADARNYYVNHIVLDFDSFKTSKLGLYIKIVEDMNDILKGLHLDYESEVFKANKVYHNLFKLNNDDYCKDIYLCIEKQDYNYLTKHSETNDEITIFKKQIKEFYPQINIIDYIFDKKPVLEENKLYICISLKESYRDHYVYNGSENLNKENVQKIVIFNKDYQELDWYTNVKCDIFNDNLLGNNKKITQGMVLRKDLGVFIRKNENEIDRKNMIKKLIKELLIKDMLFKSKFLNISHPYFEDIKIIKKFTSSEKIKGKNTVKNTYGLIHAKIDKHGMNIIDCRLSPYEEIEYLWDEYQLSNIHDEEFFTSVFMIIDDKYIIKIKNNKLNPIPLCSSDIFINEELNPLKTKKRSIKRNKDNLSNKQEFTNNLSKSFKGNFFSFYNLPKINKILGSKNTEIDSYYILEFKNKEVNYCCIDKNPLNKIVTKSNRVESLSLFKIEDFELKKIDFEKNTEILDLYLSMTTDNLININSYSKCTILEKMLNILWDN